MYQITPQQIQQTLSTIQSLSFVINQLTGVQDTSAMLQKLPEVKEEVK